MNAAAVGATGAVGAAEGAVAVARSIKARNANSLWEALSFMEWNLVLLWMGAWVVGHYSLWSLWNFCGCRSAHGVKQCRALTCSSAPLDRYRRKLFRSQIYCILASLGGIYLLYDQYHWNPHDLLYGFSPSHQMLFSMAAGHWIVSAFEDCVNYRHLNAGIFFRSSLEPKALERDVNNFFFFTYLIHHVVAGSAFVLGLCLESCTGLCTFGLIFEVPVILMNVREFVVYADNPPAWFHTWNNLRLFWRVLLILVLICRYGPTMVYLYSVFFWWDDIDALSRLESTIYHSMGIFFTCLNLGLSHMILPAWRYRDELNTVDMPASFADILLPQSNNDVPEQEFIDLSVKKLLRIEADDMEGKDGTGKEGFIWINIEDVIYDVTAFAKEHPGGEGVILQFAGKNASEAFRKVRHSHDAKRLMQKYVVGPFEVAAQRYRIFEHQADVGRTVQELWLPIMGFITTFFLLRYTPVLAAELLKSSPQDEFEELLVPGCFLAVLGFGITSLSNFFSNPRLLLLVISGRGSLVMAFLYVLYFVGLVLIRRPLLREGEGAYPGSIELVAGLLALLEEAVELLLSDRPPWTFQSSFSFALILGGWYCRGLLDLWEASPSHLYGAFLVAGCIFLLVRLIRSDDSEGSRDRILGSRPLAAATSALALFVCSKRSNQAQASLSVLWHQSWSTLCVTSVIAVVTSMSLLFALHVAYMCSPSYAARCFAFSYVFLSVCLHGVLSWRWVFLVAVWLYAGELGCRLRDKFDANRGPDFGKKVAGYQLGTIGALDQFRAFVGGVLWQGVACRVADLISSLLPEELIFYAYEIPIFDLGEDVDLGVAAYFSPHATGSGKRRHQGVATGTAIGAVSTDASSQASSSLPSFFVCNVGHMDLRKYGGLNDLQRTSNTLRECWSEFRKSNVKGLIANVVAVFATLKGTTYAKEINFSAWESKQDAHAWYDISQGHQKIVSQHGSGQVRTFGNLLASLQPTGSIRLQDRCMRCSRIVEADIIGEKPPLRCPACNAKTHDYPVF